MRQVLGVDKGPHHTIVDLQATFGQFADQTTQRKGAIMAAFQQPSPPGVGNLLRPMTAHLAGLDAAVIAPALYPRDDRADANAKALRRRTA
jgi:hypothetical protein